MNAVVVGRCVMFFFVFLRLVWRCLECVWSFPVSFCRAAWYETMGIGNIGSSANVVDWYDVQAI